MDFIKTKAACNFFIEKARDEHLSLTPMQAIKLVYFAHGYSLALLDAPLIDDHVEAWKFGAVIPSLYHELKVYGSGKIAFPILDSDKADNLDLILLSQEELRKKYKEKDIARYAFSSRETELMDTVWELYKDKSGLELSALMHRPNTPWDIVYNQKGGKYERGTVISNNLIQEYYKMRTGKDE